MENQFFLQGVQIFFIKFYLDDKEIVLVFDHLIGSEREARRPYNCTSATGFTLWKGGNCFDVLSKIN